MTTTTTTDGGLPRRGRVISLGALFALQVFCAIYFAADAFIDIFIGDTDAVPGGHFGEPFHAFEYLISGALFIGVAMTGLEIRRLLRRNARLTEQMRAASGEFAALLEEQFDAWGLTASEREVAVMALKGLSVAEIAEARDTKEGTVKAHSAAVYRKAGVSGRLQLLSFFLDELIAEPVGRTTKPAGSGP